MGQLRYLGTEEELDEGTTAGTLPAVGEVFAVEPGCSVYLGRRTEADVVVQSNRVAPEHALVALMPGTGDRLTVADLGSTNGTEVNCEAVTTAVLSPGDVLALAGLFRFRFEAETPPHVASPSRASGRSLAGLLTMLCGLVLVTFASSSHGWFLDRDGTELGLRSYRTCYEDGRCETRDLSTIFDNGSERETRSNTFVFVSGMIGMLTLCALAAAAIVLYQLLRRRNPSAVFAVIPLIGIAVAASLVSLTMLPVELSGADATRAGFAPYLYWAATAATITGAALLWSGRRRAPA